MPNSLPSRLTAIVASVAIALTAVSRVQAAPPPILLRNDPPNRVARLARVGGAVSYHTVDADRWSPAIRNSPIIGGDALWTEPGARADLQLAVNRIVLAPSTELDVTALDDHLLALSEPQGEAYLNLRAVPPGDSYSVQTPRGTMQFTSSGRYGVVAGDATRPTVVTVIEGSAQVTGPNLTLQVGPHQSATITGSDTLQGTVGRQAQDAFLTAMVAEEHPAPRASVAIPPLVQEMTGAEDLDDSGSWQETPQYGTVWYPPVDPAWVPYRHGHWSYVAPWGWTWIDDAPWGFAPFHYGRWVQVEARWGWIPAAPEAVALTRVPVYAPALVSFVEVGAAVGLAAGALAGRPVGWVPLGPREPYYPAYRANLAYIRTINAPYVPNVTQTITSVTVTNNRSVVTNFVNRGAATVIPAAAMVRSSPIAEAARAVPPEQFARAQPISRLPFGPGPQTAGVTRAVARQFNFVPATRPAQPIPGPSIRPAIVAPRFVRPEGPPALRPGPLGQPIHPLAPDLPRRVAEPMIAHPEEPRPREAFRPGPPAPSFPAPQPRPQMIARPQAAPVFQPPPAPRPQPPAAFHPPPPRPAAPPPRPAPSNRPAGREEHRP